MSKIGGWKSTGFGARLRELREERGLSQAQLSNLAGCHANTLAKLERGEHEPQWPFVLILAQTLGVGVQAFVEPAAAVETPAKRPGRPQKKTITVLPKKGGK